MRITQYRHLTNDELMNYAETRAETPLEIELLNRLSAGLTVSPYMDQIDRQMELVFGDCEG
jgi:hypothetical protein